MTSKSARKRAKRKFISLAGGATVDQKPTGLPRIHAKGRDDDPTQTVMAARERQLGMIGTKDAKALAKDPLAGCEVGKKILSVNMRAEELSDFREAVSHIRRVYVSYARAIGAPNRYPQCLRMLQPASGFTTKDAVAIDTRPQEERDRSAVSAYMTLQGWMMRGSASDMSACVAAVVDDQTVRDWGAVKRVLESVIKGMKGAK